MTDTMPNLFGVKLEMGRVIYTKSGHAYLWQFTKKTDHQVS
jgi:hypothetical protein